MERYVEVAGESQYTESAVRFVAEVVLEVRAAKDETAYRDIAIIRDEAVALLREAGLGDDEIYEGGQDLRRPWYWKKQVGQNAARKIILNVEDFERLSRALDSLEVLHKERRSVTVTMRQPEFKPSAGARTAALAEAFEDARAKAVRLSAAMGCALGAPISVEEGGATKRNSGFSGDEDWGGDYMRFAPSAMMYAGGVAGEEDHHADLQRPQRTIFVKCRARFEIITP